MAWKKKPPLSCRFCTLGKIGVVYDVILQFNYALSRNCQFLFYVNHTQAKGFGNAVLPYDVNLALTKERGVAGLVKEAVIGLQFRFAYLAESIHLFTLVFDQL